MTDFQLDLDETLDSMAFAANMDLESGDVTFFALFCAGDGTEPHFSHGGRLLLSASEAITAAQEANELGVSGCHYLAAAMGASPHLILTLARGIIGGGEHEAHDHDD